MPDTLKQIYSGTINVTGLTGNQTATLFTNNATTRVVIKDVDVTNTFPVQPNLTVGGTGVAALIGSLTGSEIVDVSQAVGISFPSALTYSGSSVSYFIGSATQRTISTYRINGLTANSVTQDQTTPSTFETFSTATYTAPDGDVFQIATDGDSRWFLYKYAGSAGGTQTTVNAGFTTSYQPVAFDGVNTFYWMTSTTNLRIFNADTETTTNVTLAAGMSAQNVRGRLVFSNGYLLYIYSDGAAPYFIEVSTGRWIHMSSSGVTVDASNNIPGLHFDTATRVATMLFLQASNSSYYRFKWNIPVLTGPSASSGTAPVSANLAAGSFQGRSAATSNAHVVLTSGDGGVIVDSTGYPCPLSSISGSTSTWRLSSPYTLTSAQYWRPRASEIASPTVNTTNFPNSIAIRITGVEVTP